MRIPRATWLSGAAMVFLAGLLSNSADLLVLSTFAVSAGLVGEALSALRTRRQEEPHWRAFQLRGLEARLLRAEDALASATQELLTLKEREFDRQARSAEMRPEESSAPHRARQS